MRAEGYSLPEIAEALKRGEGSIKDGIRRHIKGYDRSGNLRVGNGAV
jgi:transposase